MKDAFYFPHFSNARHDRKIKRLIKDLGIEGYGIYFMLLEILRDQQDLKYPFGDHDLLADEFGTSAAKIEAVILRYELFNVDSENDFFSPKFLAYLQPYFDRKTQAKLAGIESGKRRKHMAIEHQTNGRSTAVEHQTNKERKGKESKSKEIQEKEIQEKKIDDDVVTAAAPVNVIKAFNENIMPITAMIASKLGDDVDEFGEVWVVRAIEKASEQGKRSYSYVRGVLMGWRSDGFDARAAPWTEKRQRGKTDPFAEAIAELKVEGKM